MFSRICTLNIHLTYSQHTKYSQSKTTPFIGLVTGDTNISNKVDLGERQIWAGYPYSGRGYPYSSWERLSKCNENKGIW